MELLENYHSALEAIHDHIGFVEEWRVYPINDSSLYVWQIRNENVVFWDSLEQYNSMDLEDGLKEPYYSEIIINDQVFNGSIYTGIFIDTQTDGNKFLSIFKNSNKIL